MTVAKAGRIQRREEPSVVWRKVLCDSSVGSKLMRYRTAEGQGLCYVTTTRVMNMLASMPLSRRLAIWLFAFFSPTAYFLVLLFAARLPISRGVSEALVVLLFCVIPVVALLVCESLVWSARVTVGWKIGGMVFTFLASVLQFAFILVVVRAILITAISYPQ